MIDIHTHILPGVDDGVETEDEAVAFARVALEDGTRTLVATPHCKEGFYVNDREAVLAGVDRLRARLRDEQVDLEVLPGAEVHLCDDLVARIADGRAPTLADNGKTLLLELSLGQPHTGLEDLVFQLRLAGIVIVLAHPERIRYFQEDPARYEELVRLGVFGQITTGSILGTFGRTAAAYSEELLRKGLVHALASDAHNVRGRSPRLREALDATVRLVGEERARSMVDDVPRAFLEGREPDVEPIEAPRPRRKTSLWSRLFRRSG